MNNNFTFPNPSYTIKSSFDLYPSSSQHFKDPGLYQTYTEQKLNQLASHHFPNFNNSNPLQSPFSMPQEVKPLTPPSLQQHFPSPLSFPSQLSHTGNPQQLHLTMTRAPAVHDLTMNILTAL